MTGKHKDRDVYVAWVLWVIGMSEQSIAAITLKRKKQISGIINRSPYTNRSSMSDDARRKALDELLAIRVGDDAKRLDGGVLDKIPLKIIPLRSSQVKRRAS